MKKEPNCLPRVIAGLLGGIALVATVGCGGPPRPPERPTFERVAVNQRGIGIPYGAVVLFRADQELVALRVVEAPKWGYWIEYEWNTAPLTADVFETASTGAGETNEQKNGAPCSPGRSICGGPAGRRISAGSTGPKI